MIELLRDPIWQFIGAVVAVAFGIMAIVEDILRTRSQLRSKRLSYWIANLETIARSPEATKDALQISFDGSPITDLVLLSITLQNHGNVPIVPTDFVEPLRFGFGKGARVLKAEVTHKDPLEIDASLTAEASSVVLNPLLLNSLDALGVLVYVTDYESVSATARIVGVKQVVRQRPVEDRDIWFRMRRTAWLVLPPFSLLVLAWILQSDFLLGFSVAGIVGYIFQRILLHRKPRA